MYSRHLILLSIEKFLLPILLYTLQYICFAIGLFVWNSEGIDESRLKLYTRKPYKWHDFSNFSEKGGIHLRPVPGGVGLSTPIWGPKQFQEQIHEELITVKIEVETFEVEGTGEVTIQPPDEGSPGVSIH